MIRADVRARFQAVVARGIARADRERLEELARIRPVRRRQSRAARGRVHDEVAAPRARVRELGS